MAYVDKKNGKPTGSWVGEWAKGKKKRRFKTKADAEAYEVFCKLMNREPPAIEDGGPSGGEQTFREVAELAKKHGGPTGRWHKNRDPSLMQRLEYAVGIIGDLGITRVNRGALRSIAQALDTHPPKGARGWDATREGYSNATKNRYIQAAHSVLVFAANEDLIPAAPQAPLLDEKGDKRKRDIIQLDAEQEVYRHMREAGKAREALCAEALLATGLRSGELVTRLRPEQITIERAVDEEGTVVRRGVIKLGEDQTKNDQERMVILRPELAKQIRDLIVAGQMPTSQQLLNSFKAACKHAGVNGNVVIHSLRHTRNTRLDKAGVDKEKRKAQLGHMSDAANEIYTHYDLDTHLAVEKKVENWAGKMRKNAAAAKSQGIDLPE